MTFYGVSSGVCSEEENPLLGIKRCIPLPFICCLRTLLLVLSSYWKCCYAVVHHLGRHSHIFCAIPIGEKANAPRRVNCARPATSTCYANAVTYVEEEMTPGRSWPLVAPDPYAAVPDRPSGVAGRPLACRTVHFLWIALYTSTTM